MIEATLIYLGIVLLATWVVFADERARKNKKK